MVEFFAGRRRERAAFGRARYSLHLQVSDVTSIRCRSTLAGMSAARQTMGVKGERVAEKWLSVHGWEIAERRFKNGHRDIDSSRHVSRRAGRNGPWPSSKLRPELLQILVGP